MKSINLIPRKPWHEKYFILIFILIAAAVMIPLINMISLTIASSEKADALAVKLAQKQKEIARMRNVKTADELTSKYEHLALSIKQIVNNRINWLPLLSSITDQLPQLSSLRSIEAGGEERMSVLLQFEELEQIDHYVRQIESTEMFQVHLQTVQRETGNQDDRNPKFFVTMELGIKQYDRKAAEIQ